MARFRATMQGQRGQASRLGNAKTGMQVKVNGWNCGIDVDASVNAAGYDSFDVWQTGGSNGRADRLIATVTYNSETMKAEIVG